MTPLLGFTPDAPTTADGIIVDCANFIPYEAGMKAAPSAVAQGGSALGAATRGATTITRLDASRRVFVGTTAEIRELSGTTFTDRTRGAGYSLGAGTHWSWVQFGDNTYAVNIDTVVQKSTTAAFADVSGAPKAKVIASLLTSGGGFVFAFNTIDGTYGTSPDRWWNSALNDGDDWAVNPTVTLCNTGRLLGAEGPITAAKSFGSDRIMAYKDRSIYAGRFVGGASVFEWTEIPSIGCAGPDAIVDIGTAHVFVGQDNIYMFDGARPFSIADGQTRQWFLDNSSITYRQYAQMQYDRDAKLIWIFFASNNSTTGLPDRALVYHLATKQWGRADRNMETAFIYNTPALTWDGGSGTWDAQTNSWDQSNPGNRILAFYDTAHTLYLLNGTPGSSYFVSNDIGNDSAVSKLIEVSLRYMTAPTTASTSAYYSMATGGNPSVGLTQSAYDVPANGSNKFKFRQTARFHRIQFNFTGAVKVVGYEATKLMPAGTR